MVENGVVGWIRPVRSGGLFAAAVALGGALLGVGCSSAPPQEATARQTQALTTQVGMTATALKRDGLLSSEYVETSLRWYGMVPPTTPPVSDGWTPLAKCTSSSPCQLYSSPGVGPWTQTTTASSVVLDGKLLLQVQGAGPSQPSFEYCFSVSLNPATGALSPAATDPGVCNPLSGGLRPDPAIDIQCGAAASPALPANTCRFDAYVSNSPTRTSEPWTLTFSSAQSDNNCNGIDDDGDGQIDEEYVPTATTCAQASCVGAGSLTCVGGSLVDTCSVPTSPDNNCNGVDDDCDGQIDDEYPRPVTSCGIGACQRSGHLECVTGATVNVCQPGTASAEILDGIDNDCDGQVDECNPGQTDWWCCSQTGQTTLNFNVVPSTDQSPPGACSPLSVSQSATCSLRGVFEIADHATRNGCTVNANVGGGTYPLASELLLTRGTLRLNGPQDPAAVSIEPLVSPGTCPALCGESCKASCHTTCSPDCDAACNPQRDAQCVQVCTRAIDHRLVHLAQASGSAPRLELNRLTLRGGRAGNGMTLADGGGVLVSGGTFLADHIVVENNWATSFGAGIAIDSAANATLFGSVIRNNVNEQVGNSCEVSTLSQVANGATARGGGVHVTGGSTLLIDSSAITGNVSSDGGGIAAEGSGSLTIRNSTISGNGVPGRAGGLLTAINTTLEFNTITFNTAGWNAGSDGNRRGGGLATDMFAAGGTLRAFGNIIGGNRLQEAAGPIGSMDCSFTSAAPLPTLVRGYNLIGQAQNDCAVFVSALDRTNVDPALVMVKKFPVDFAPATAETLVHALTPTSPAVNFYPGVPQAGLTAPTCPVYDQRGYLRDPSSCDLGAYEVGGLPDSDKDGITDSLDPTPFAFSSAFSDIPMFGTTTGSIVNRNGHTVVITDAKTGVNVSVLGTSGAAVQISACGSTTSIAGGQSKVITCARPTNCLFAGQTLTVRDRARVQTKFFSKTFAVGSDAVVLGRGLATGNGSLGDRGSMNGGATLGGVLSGYRAGVRNGLVEHASVPLQTLLERSFTSAGTTIEIPREGTLTLAPGNYGALIVRYHGRLTLSQAGIYRFTSVLFESDTYLTVPGGADRTVIATSGNLTLGDRLLVAKNGGGTLLREDTLFYANGSALEVGFNTALIGDVEGPFATVQLRDRSSVNGCVGGRNVTVGFDVVMGDGGI